MSEIATPRAAAAKRRPIALVPPTARLDFATLGGVLGAFALIASAIALGGSPGAFIDLPSMLIVLGGTLMVTAISYSLGEIFRSSGIVLRALLYHREDPSRTALNMIALADRARQRGSLDLQNILEQLRHDRFLYKAVQLIVDGMPGDEIERMLSREVDVTAQRHRRSAGILRRAAEVAPAMGLIGTLVGLVQMLGNLQDPESIGPAMAVALLTTFYGAILANMVFLPLANKLDRNSGLEGQVKQLIALGAASIGRQENPRRLEILLNTLLAPEARVRYFD